ncbi:MAG: hypothetical protein Q8N23_29315 [Archangium sp.]|nr:hypothetical protein [Archangium sp.]MDP3156805.1 hypothetical protein [Archangium sp.]MDP3569653.1 hypothetical protein [Archangium sp.]
MRLERHARLVLSILCGSLHAAAQPLMLSPLPLPGRFSDLHQSSSGALLVDYGAWSEWGGARLSMLRRNGRWMQVPAGAAFEWKDWLVFEGLFPVPHVDDESAPPRSPWDGGTLVVTLGTDDVFVRRVVLVDGKSGQTFDAPWDSFAPLPLAKGETWLVWRCPVRALADGGVEEPIELLSWTPRTGRVHFVGVLPGEGRTSCSSASAATSLSVVVFPEGGLRTSYGRTSFAYAPVVIPSRDGALAQLIVDGGTHWVQLDARGRVTRTDLDAGVELSAAPADAGSPLVPLRRVSEAFREVQALETLDGGTLTGRSLDGGPPFPLTQSLGGGFAVYDGLVFVDEGVFLLPKGADQLMR